jgi:hypothetical protein
VTEIRKTALFNSLATTGYIVLIGLFMYFGERTQIGRTNAFLAPIAFLLLFVFSAALTGFLVFGRPAIMYIDGKKKEALELLFTTLAFFFVITASAILLLFLFTRS